MLAIRIAGVGRYFGPRVEFDGSVRPREAWRTLLRIAGIDLKDLTDDHTQRTIASGGHVLRDITLDVEQGSVVCLTGPSGSGKSVLLQILGRVIAPTAGRVELYAPVTSLLAIGDNLDARMTADENIRASQQYLELAAAGREGYVRDVFDFAELHGFEHVPLRTYSTGMMLRLSVAVALCGRPSLVLIDDVLAVGDIAFQQKCVDRVDELKRAGSTLVLAFSDDALVQQLATRVITLGGGRVVSDTQAPESARAPSAGGAVGLEWEVAQAFAEDDAMALRSVAVEPGPGDAGYIDVSMGFLPKATGVRCRPSLFLMRGKTVIYRSLYPTFVTVTETRPLTWTVRVPTDILPASTYSFIVNMQTLQGATVYAMKAQDAVTLTVRRTGGLDADAPVPPVLTVELPWEIETVQEPT